MTLGTLKQQLMDISTCFYQGKNEDGLSQFETVLAGVLSVPEFAGLVEPLMEALQEKDYVLLADIFYYEMAMKIQ